MPSDTIMSDPFRDTTPPPKSRSSRRSKPGEPLDQIDLLDGSGQFGGATFHHDGPFDAVRPHRNRSNSAVKPAPLDAFPVNGASNQLLSVVSARNDDTKASSDGDPTKILLSNADDEPFSDFNQATNEKYVAGTAAVGSTPVHANPYSIAATQSVNSSSTLTRDSIVNFDASTNADPVHGDLTNGLGTSTFLDGAPAPNSYLRVSSGEPGVKRKKSLIKKIIG